MEERNYKLYVHISPSNKRYYGITGQKRVQDRWDYGRGYIGNEHFTNAINKYGWDNIEHIILFDNLTKEEVCLLEQMYIALYDTTNPMYGYNNSLGGEHGLVSEQTKKKISKANKGKKRTEEQIKKNSECQKGKKLTEETKKKMSEAQKGHEVTEETKKKISKAQKGEKSYNYGKQRSEETKNKLKESMKGKNGKPLLMFTKDGQFIKRFVCVADANEYLGKDRNNSNIKTCAIGRANGRNTTAYDYIWIYEQDYIKEQERAI